MSFSTEQNDHDFIHGETALWDADLRAKVAAGMAELDAGQGISDEFVEADFAASRAGYGQSYATLEPTLSPTAIAAQTRIDNLRGIALRQAADVQAAKYVNDSGALDADRVIQSARQFYAFLSGDTPTEGN